MDVLSEAMGTAMIAEWKQKNPKLAHIMEPVEKEFAYLATVEDDVRERGQTKLGELAELTASSVTLLCSTSPAFLRSATEGVEMLVAMLQSLMESAYLRGRRDGMGEGWDDAREHYQVHRGEFD